ncbi:MAG: GntR family transcriptional regulator [Anaerolineales bacterium]|nr:GntR family transcriptional regulator [Anaerolineales bacterium]
MPELRRTIIRGYFKPGEKIDILKLAEHYKSSITPVRDALRMLSQEGLVTIKPRSGYFVSQITVRQLCDLFEVREILEAAAIQRAAKRITLEQIEQLNHDYTGYVDEFYDRYIDENRRFHCLIAKASGNQELEQMLGRVHDQLARFIFLVFLHTDKTQEQTHARIIEALRERDAETALEAMLDEIRNTRDVVLAQVMEKQGAFWQIRDLETGKRQTLEV